MDLLNIKLSRFLNAKDAGLEKQIAHLFENLKSAVPRNHRLLEKMAKAASVFSDAFDRAFTLKNIADSLAAIGKHSEALSALESAVGSYDETLGRNSNLVEAYNNKANALSTKAEILSALGKHSEALSALESAVGSYDETLGRNSNLLEAYNNKATALSTKAEILSALGKHSEALSALESAVGSYDETLGRNPNYVNAYNNKANALLTKAKILSALGKHSEALSALESAVGSYDEALGRNSNYVNAYNNKANALLTKAAILAAIGEQSDDVYEQLIESSKTAIDSMLKIKAYAKVSDFYLHILIAVLKSSHTDETLFWESICRLLEFSDDESLVKYAHRLLQTQIDKKIELGSYKTRIEAPICKKRFEAFLELLAKIKEHLKTA